MAVRSDSVCILGTPASGKSTYLIALYYSLTEDYRYQNYLVSFPKGDDSEMYYKDQLTKLKENGFLDPTLRSNLYDAGMLVKDHTGRNVLRVSTKDASGEDLEQLFRTDYRNLRAYLRNENETQLKMEDSLILDLMKSSQNFIFFWDPDIKADGYNQTIFLKNIVRTLEEIHGDDWSKLAVALLITKSDAFPHVNNTYPYLFKHSSDLITRLKAHLGTRFVTFPISSLGGFRWVMGREKKGMGCKKELAPKNVVEPLIWFQRLESENQPFYRHGGSRGGMHLYETPIDHDGWVSDSGPF
ncbi:MAG: hypothetical protein JW779_14985 [Candidatus Thorarchaeota archaeon]|nr:hypothetical protein [Candidatus Thorarchaeota archaeon]